MPATTLLESRMDAEREWLGRQVIFQAGWEAGRSVVTGSLDEWIDEYAGQLLGTGIPHRLLEGCRLRLWSAWSYHWQQAARRSATGQADGLAVAHTVRAGVRPGHSHPMGGDPFRDAVLAEACLAGVDQALNRFFREYQATFDQEARHVFRREPDGDLWGDLFLKLVGAAPGEGRLVLFTAYSSLRAWLRPVARRFVWDYCRLEQLRKVAERRAALLHPPQSAHPSPTEWDETLDWCRGQVVQGLASLEPRDRLLLLLRFRSGWSGSAIAGLLKVHPGHFSRLLEQATERFRRQLASPWEELFQDYDALAVAYFLFRGLDEAHVEVPAMNTQSLTGEEEAAMSKVQKDPARDARRAQRPAGRTRKKSAESKASTPPRAKKPAQDAGSEQLAGRTRVKSAKHETPTPVREKESMPEIGPEELEQFLPESMVAVSTEENPEDLFPRWEGRPVDQRPAVVCLDGRQETDLTRVLSWLERFDTMVSEQYEGDPRSPYEPHRVVFLSKEVPEPPADVRGNPDIDWVRTEDAATDVLALYRHYLQNDLYDFVNGDLEGFFPDAPPGDTASLAELLPASKREALRARLKEFKEREDEA